MDASIVMREVARARFGGIPRYPPRRMRGFYGAARDASSAITGKEHGAAAIFPTAGGATRGTPRAGGTAEPHQRSVFMRPSLSPMSPDCFVTDVPDRSTSPSRRWRSDTGLQLTGMKGKILAHLQLHAVDLGEEPGCR